MKKYLLWLPVVWLSLGAAIYSTGKENAASGKVVNKSILFAVYKGNNYASEVYNNTSAKLHITIVKVRGKNRTTVWDKTFNAKLLKEYPALENALSQQVTVPNMLDNKEQIGR